jgi:hypothetical protein
VTSSGEGREPVGLIAINAGAVNGTWVLIQNCELGLGLMNDMELMINKLKGRESSQERSSEEFNSLGEGPLDGPII